MRTRSIRLVLAFTLTLAAASCRDAVETVSAPQTTGAFQSPAPAQAAAAAPAGSSAGSLQPDDPNDPLLLGYCSAQDRVITLEGKLLSGQPSLGSSLAKMREAKRSARSAEEMFRQAGDQRLALLASRWTRSFDEVRARLIRGERPFDALRPAIAALGNIEEVFTCELDG